MMGSQERYIEVYKLNSILRHCIVSLEEVGDRLSALETYEDSNRYDMFIKEDERYIKLQKAKRLLESLVRNGGLA